jgi:hypothetical protein
LPFTFSTCSDDRRGGQDVFQDDDVVGLVELLGTRGRADDGDEDECGQHGEAEPRTCVVHALFPHSGDGLDSRSLRARERTRFVAFVT